MSFYPINYVLPEKPKNEDLISDYMRLDQGEYRIRILMPPIIGFETWTGQGTGSVSHRAKTFEEAVNLPSRDGKVKEFHAFIVWDYAEKMVRLLKVTQQSIKEPIYNQTCDEDWADPTQYDIVIKRTGEGLEDTKYTVTFKLPKPQDEEIKKAFSNVIIDPQKYFEGGHPIIRKDSAEETTINTKEVANDIPF